MEVAISSTIRTLVGFLVAPIACGLVVALWFILNFVLSIWKAAFGFALAPLALDVQLDVVLFYTLLATVVGYGTTFIFGVPSYFRMRYLRWRLLRAYTLVGGVLGILVYEITWPGPKTAIWETYDARFVSSALFGDLLCFSGGAVAAATFWFIVRPDQQRARD